MSVGTRHPSLTSLRPFNTITRTSPCSDPSSSVRAHPDASGPSSANSAPIAVHIIASLRMIRLRAPAIAASLRAVAGIPGIIPTSIFRCHSKPRASWALADVRPVASSLARVRGPFGRLRNASNTVRRKNRSRTVRPLRRHALPRFSSGDEKAPPATLDNGLCGSAVTA